MSNPMQKLRIVAATPCQIDAFVDFTLLGRSVKNLSWDRRIKTSICCSNSQGLPVVYNRAIEESADNEAILFVHDDIMIEDFHLFTRIVDALTVFDVIGVAGNIKPAPNQITWTHTLDETGAVKPCERSVLSGFIGQIVDNQRNFAFYGPFPQQCALLDGCFLAAKASALRQRQVRFDTRFDFHFYDLDFCRTCIKNGLRLGTWPIAVTHKSLGNFDTPQWRAALDVYQRKWPAGSVP